MRNEAKKETATERAKEPLTSDAQMTDGRLLINAYRCRRIKSSNECLLPSPVLLLLLPVRLNRTKAFTHTHRHPHPYAHTTPMPPGTADSERCVLRGCGSGSAKVLLLVALASILEVVETVGVTGVVGGGGGRRGDC